MERGEAGKARGKSGKTKKGKKEHPQEPLQDDDGGYIGALEDGNASIGSKSGGTHRGGSGGSGEEKASSSGCSRISGNSHGSGGSGMGSNKMDGESSFDDQSSEAKPDKGSESSDGTGGGCGGGGSDGGSDVDSVTSSKLSVAVFDMLGGEGEGLPPAPHPRTPPPSPPRTEEPPEPAPKPDPPPRDGTPTDSGSGGGTPSRKRQRQADPPAPIGPDIIPQLDPPAPRPAAVPQPPPVPAALEGERNVAVKVKGGTIKYDCRLKAFFAICDDAEHKNEYPYSCSVSRTRYHSDVKGRGGQGRPLGLLVEWLSYYPANLLRSGHVHGHLNVLKLEGCWQRRKTARDGLYTRISEPDVLFLFKKEARRVGQGYNYEPPAVP